METDQPLPGAWVGRILTKGPIDFLIAPSTHPNLKLHIYEDKDPASQHCGLKLCWILLPHSSTRMTVSDIGKSGQSSTIYTALAHTSDVVVMNGGFFGYGPQNSYVLIGLVVMKSGWQAVFPIADDRFKTNDLTYSAGGFVN